MKNICFLLLIICLNNSCTTEKIKILPLHKIKRATLLTTSKNKIKTSLAITPQEQQRGLSGVMKKDFSDNQAMLFFNTSDAKRSFWMPNTYFNLDIFFLDKNLKVIDVDRNVQHYPHPITDPKLIPRARSVISRHVLEMKSSSKISKNIRIGDRLRWISKPSLQQTELSILAH